MIAARNNGRGLGGTVRKRPLRAGTAAKAVLVGSERLTILAATFALAGCGLAHPKTVYLTRNCVSRPQYEKFRDGEPPKVHDKLTGQGDADTRPLAGSAYELRSWGRAMLGTLDVCSRTDPHALADKLLNDSSK